MPRQNWNQVNSPFDASDFDEGEILLEQMKAVLKQLYSESLNAYKRLSSEAGQERARKELQQGLDVYNSFEIYLLTLARRARAASPKGKDRARSELLREHAETLIDWADELDSQDNKTLA